MLSENKYLFWKRTVKVGRGGKTRLRTLVGWNSRMEPKLRADWREGAVSVGGVALTELAGAHVLQYGVRFHLVVTWRADGGVTCGRKTGGVVRRSVRGKATMRAVNHSRGFTSALFPSPPIWAAVQTGRP